MSPESSPNDTGFVALADRMSRGLEKEPGGCDDGISGDSTFYRDVVIEDDSLLLIDASANCSELIVDEIGEGEFLVTVGIVLRPQKGEKYDVIAVLRRNGIARYPFADNEITIGVNFGLQTRVIVECLKRCGGDVFGQQDFGSWHRMSFGSVAHLDSRRLTSPVVPAYSSPNRSMKGFPPSQVRFNSIESVGPVTSMVRPDVSGLA